MAQSSQAKGKETMSVELSRDVHSKAKKNAFNNQESKFPPKKYSFKDEQVVAIFHLLHKANKLKLPDAWRPNEVGRTNDPNYCLFHRMVHYPTNKCFVLNKQFSNQARQYLGSFVRPISLGRRAFGSFNLFSLWSKWNIVTT